MGNSRNGDAQRVEGLLLRDQVVGVGVSSASVSGQRFSPPILAGCPRRTGCSRSPCCPVPALLFFPIQLSSLQLSPTQIQLYILAHCSAHSRGLRNPRVTAICYPPPEEEEGRRSGDASPILSLPVRSSKSRPRSSLAIQKTQCSVGAGRSRVQQPSRDPLQPRQQYGSLA